MRRLSKAIALALFALTTVGFAQQQGGTLVAAWAQDPVGLDPHITSARSSLQKLENILDTLVVLDVDQNVQPSLAESWEVAEDGLTWTFNPRDGVKFSNGRDLTAEADEFTYNRTHDPQTASAPTYLHARVTDVSATDESTVAFTLEAPNPAFLSKLASNKAVGIIARESVEDGSINTSPLGSGPFMIADFHPCIQLSLERNTH